MARILVISTYYPPHHYGGYELVCQDVVDRWRDRGHEVTVLTSSTRLPGVATPPEESRGEVRRDLGVFVEPGHFISVPLLSRPRFEKVNQAALQDAMAAIKPDVISIWHMLGMSQGLLLTLCRLGIPMVCVVADRWPGYVVGTDQWMKLWRRLPPLWSTVERVFGVPTAIPDLGRTASFCFVSEYIRDLCATSSPWSFDQATVCYHGINTDDFPITRGRQRETWSWRLVTAGRLDPGKGFATAIESLAHLPGEATLEVFSSADDPYRHKLQATAERLGVGHRVAFGMRTRSALRQEFLAADAVIFPSEWEEPFGLIPIEAMACGTPVVATGVGGSGEFLLDEQSCLRFRPGDPQSLANAVVRLADSSDLRSRLVETGWTLAEELTVDRLAAALEQWHLAAAHGFPEGPPPGRQLQGLRPLRPL